MKIQTARSTWVLCSVKGIKDFDRAFLVFKINMANPQKENGYIPIASEIADALMKTQLNGYQSRILWAIWRKTYGYNKSEDWISNSQLVTMTGLHKAHICRAIKQLLARKIVTKNGNKIKFSKDYSQWCELPKMVTVTKNGNTVANSGNSELPELATQLPKMADTINNYTKDNITKEDTNVSTAKAVDKRNPEISKMIEALKLKIHISDFVDSRIERKIAKHCVGLLQRIGKEEFVRRLDIILEDDFKHNNCNSIRYVYNQIKGFIDPREGNKVAFIS